MINLNGDRIVSLTALLVGLGSLFVIVYQTNLARQSQRASVLPCLSIALTSNDAGVFLVVGNVGIGPALIQDVRVRYQGRRSETIHTSSSPAFTKSVSASCQWTKSSRAD